MTKTAVAPSTTRSAVPVLGRARVPFVQRKCACENSSAPCPSCAKGEAEPKRKEPEQKLQRKASGAHAPAVAPASVGRVLSSPGRPMEPPVRSFMEQRFGRDFSGVRIHTGPAAEESARAVDAHAYTVGQHIAFDHGRYDPHSAGGQRLLAHELAHTVQQHGLQRYSGDLHLAEGAEGHGLEREADAAAAAAVDRGAPAPALTHRPAQPVISRVVAKPKKTATGDSKTPDEDPARDWHDVDPASDLGQAGVKKRAIPGKGARKEIMAFEMGNLNLPPTKGNVLKIWQARADAGSLEATILKGEDEPRSKAGLKQERPPTDTLRQIWLLKVGWDKSEAADRWVAAGGDGKEKDGTVKKTAFDPPKGDGKTCQVDHIVELQFGGSNVKENMQMLDGKENEASGRDLFRYLKDLADRIRAALTKEDPANVPDYILMHFSSVTQDPGPTCLACCKADAAAVEKGSTRAKGESVSGVKGTPFPISAGGTATDIIVPADAPKNKPLKIRESELPENKYASTLISGLRLETLHLNKSPHEITALMDTGEDTKSRLPVTIEGEPPINVHVAKDGALTIPHASRNIKFQYPFLSPGEFTELSMAKDGSLSGKGAIHPRIKFLPTLQVKFNRDSFDLAVPIDKNKMQPPISGAKITEASIGMQLAPEFKPYGKLGFELNPGKKLLAGSLEVSADAQGLVAQGKLNAFLPGVDNAEGNIEYRGGVWSGGVTVQAADLKNKLKYVQSGSVSVALASNKEGIDVQGTLMLAIPGTEGVTVHAHYAQHRWLFRGHGKFNVPRLEPVGVDVEYDDEEGLRGTGETGFKLFGATGHVKLTYRHGRFSGTGDLHVQKGKADGTLKVNVRQTEDGHVKFSGKGDVTYQISENLIAKGGIEVDEEEHVRVMGGLSFPKPIPLFKPFGDRYTIFEIGTSIPIPGLSIGGIGLNARIDGSLSAGYQIGPGEVRNAKAEVEFNPFDEKPDFELTIEGEPYIGLHGDVTGEIKAGIEISAVVAKAWGQFTITATATLDGFAKSHIKIHYKQSRIEAEADFTAQLAIALIIALGVEIGAKAGWGWLSVSTSKNWTLKAFRYDPGLSLGMSLKKPIKYVQGEGIELPSVNDIEFVKPKLDRDHMLKSLMETGPPDKEDS